VEAEAEAEEPRNMPLPLPLCFKVGVQILVDVCYFFQILFDVYLIYVQIVLVSLRMMIDNIS
jgi:hypothetical protein